jgi:hypothetical protein
MKWWFEYGDIDEAWDFYYSEEAPHGTYGTLHGPFDTFGEAKTELLHIMRHCVKELRMGISSVKDAKSSNYKERS